jgi:putative transposase
LPAPLQPSLQLWYGLLKAVKDFHTSIFVAIQNKSYIHGQIQTIPNVPTFLCRGKWPENLSSLKLDFHFLTVQICDMKRNKFSEGQILAILKEQEGGLKVADICRKHGISDATFFNWKNRYGGMTLSELKRVKELEEENSRLKRMYANLSLEHEALKDVLVKKL